MTRRPPHPYARRHLAAHAAAGGRLDDVLNLETLPYLDQARLSSLLRLTEAEPNTLKWLLLSAWRSVRHRWSWDDLDANAAALDVAFLAAGGAETPDRHTTSGLTWKPLWVEWHSGGTIVASEARGRVRIAIGKPQGVPMLATAEGWQIRLWDPATGQTMGEPLVPPHHVRTLVIASTPGLLVAVCDGGRVIVWDAVTRLQLTTVEIPEPGPRALAVGELDGAWVVAAGGTTGVLHLRSLEGGQQIRMIRADSPVRDAALATAADGRLYVAIGYGDGHVQVHDVGTGAPAGQGVSLGHEINAVALAADEERLLLAAGSADRTARVWDALTSRAVSEPFQHGDEVRSVAVTTTGQQQLLATGSLDHNAQVWHIHGSYPETTLPHPAPVESVAFGEIEGRMMLATGCLDGNTRLWDPVRPSAARVAVEGWLSSVRLDAGIVVAGGPGSVRLWDRASGNPHPAFTVQPGGEPLYKTLRAPGVDVRLGFIEGRRTLTTLYRGRVAAWDLDDMYAPTLRGETTTSEFGAIDADVIRDRALAASADLSGMVRVVDLLGGVEAFRLPLRGAHLVGFVSAPGRAVLAVDGDIGVHLLDAESGEPLYAPLPVAFPKHAAVGRLDGTEVLAALDTDGLRLYDLRSGELTLPPLEMSSTANGIAWVRVGDRELIVTAHFATVRVWNPRTGRKVSELPFGTEIAGMAVHEAADGGVIIAVSGPGLVLLELRAAHS